MTKNVNSELHPDRYGGESVYECKKVLENWLSEEAYEGWLIGNIIKYLSRFGKKDPKIQEAKKIEAYAQFLREFEEKQNEGN